MLHGGHSRMSSDERNSTAQPKRGRGALGSKPFRPRAPPSLSGLGVRKESPFREASEVRGDESPVRLKGAWSIALGVRRGRGLDLDATESSWKCFWERH